MDRGKVLWEQSQKVKQLTAVVDRLAAQLRRVGIDPQVGQRKVGMNCPGTPPVLGLTFSRRFFCVGTRTEVFSSAARYAMQRRKTAAQKVLKRRWLWRRKSSPAPPVAKLRLVETTRSVYRRK